MNLKHHKVKLAYVNLQLFTVKNHAGRWGEREHAPACASLGEERMEGGRRKRGDFIDDIHIYILGHEGAISSPSV